MALTLTNQMLPARIRLEKPMTDDELVRLCEANDSLHIERATNGELIVMTPSGTGTGRKNAEIIVDLGLWARQDGRGIVFDSNTGFSLPDGSMLSPDAAWVQANRWNTLSEESRNRFAPICPDFIIELRSPSDNLAGLQAKMEQWIGNGADTAWLIDPIEQTVHIYRPGQPAEVHVHPTSVQGHGIIAGFELVMERIWQ